MKLKIAHAECHPECLVIVFQGHYKAECEEDYLTLEKEIQGIDKVKKNIYVGGSCLVEDAEGTWHRGRVLEKRENICKAFLIDTGQVLTVEETHLASACDEFFQLPPKVVLGVFASILPLGEKWGPKAINYFSSLVGLQITGHVKAVLPYQVFILEVPKIISDVLDLQLGKFIDGDSFCFIVEMLRAFPREVLCARVPRLLQQKHPVKESLTFGNSATDFQRVPGALFPRLPVGSKENVKVTVAVSPKKFYCQMEKWQKKLEDMTADMHLCYEAISTENDKSSGVLGLLCAAKRQNGQWHRGVIRQVLSDRVEVWFMDFGDIEAVPSSRVQKLKAEFMILPMMSFPCALSCFGSQDETVIKIQLKKLTQTLTEQTSVCVHVDLYSDIERLYYITLQNQNLGIGATHPENLNEAAAFQNCPENKHTKPCLPERDISLASHFKRVGMKINSSYTASVVYVVNPSDFWIQACEYENDFQALMKNIADAYNRCEADDMVLKKPETGLLCCARYSKDRQYYRGVVTEVFHVNVTVFFFDFGYTDTVPCYDVKTLLPEFSDLPALAMCCALACTFPVDEVWAKKEIDFFREFVLNKKLLLHVIGKQNKNYTVNVLFNDGLEQESVAMCMVRAGYAEYWENTADSVLNSAKKRVLLKHLQAVLPDFLTLESQAFQCGLKNVPLQMESSNWSEEARRHFEYFISASRGPLTCIVYAVVVVSPNCLCNIVDLQTPSVSAEEFLRERGLIQSEDIGLRNLASLGSLYSFCYSSFNIKIGSEEEVYITNIHSPSNFYCQLNRNTETIEALMKKVSALSKMSNNAKYDTSSTRLCIARYFEDGLFYRALAFPVESTPYVRVDFVDFGNRSMVEKDQLIPIPDSATELLFTPMQAIKCCLSDLRKTKISVGVARWFEEAFHGKLLKAVIVSRQSNGQIVVELYDGQLKVSQKIEEKILALKNSAEQFGGSNKGVIDHMEDDEEINKVTVKNPELKCHVYDKYYQTDTGQNFEDEEQNACSIPKLSSGSSKLLASQDSEEPGFGNTVNAILEHREEPLVEEPASHSPCHPALNAREITVDALSESHNERLNSTGQQERSNGKIPTLISLPQRDIQVNSKVAGYISHVNSPSSFYIQLAEDEKLIIQLAEELNESMVNIRDENGLNELVVGDVVVAEYDTDGFYYRAVIKTLKSGNAFEVEFIDYGNTAVVSSSKICRAQRKFLALPRLSVHCCLRRLKSVPDKAWASKITSYFESKVNKAVACKFLQQRGEQWEVDIICDGKSMSDDLLRKKNRTRQRNIPKPNRKYFPRQKFKSGDLQDRNSRNGLRHQSQTKVIGMKNTSKPPLNIPPQDLNYGEVQLAKVTSISESGEFHVLLHRNVQILRQLKVTLVEEVQRSDFLRVDDIEEGLECLVESRRNLEWCRSKVMKKFVREKLMLVFFMDYGNWEVVSLNKAKMLSDEMKSISKQAVFCKWVWFKNLTGIQFVHAVNIFLLHEIRILFLRYLESSHVWEVDILIGNLLLQDYLNQHLSHCQAVVGPEESSNTDCKEFDRSFKRNSIPWTLLDSDKRYFGFATAVTDPSNFCIQFEFLFEYMVSLSLLLSDLPDDLPPLPKELVAPGARCLIRFGPTAEWHRAEISKVTSQSVVLTLTDFGFLNSIPYSDIHKLKIIPESVSILPCLVSSCSLHNLVPAKGRCWDHEAKLLFRELLSQPCLRVCFKHYGSELKLEVDVLYEEKDVSHILIAAGHAVYSKSRCCPIPVDRIT
ncbi:PREDICTED: tudor domain-containing protein 15-like [Buceros rhinoceros silvestris]|uniref:tudor domain-containing protein 15-like n=1 Tax=Buceros rhinoceros silvestris TaxID=175836 RepID=UPI0005292696|nr:PREDICTED: tudor domain-containing protein 15-like [Buceros rhinoceros silvestris]